MRSIVLVVHNVRSAHNVGSMLRTAEGLGIDKVYLSGYTPYPAKKNDERLAHEAAVVDRKISKTALGAEKIVKWQAAENIAKLISELKGKGYEIVALEQTKDSTSLSRFKPKGSVALIVGSEVGGLDKMVLDQCNLAVQIPMSGKKESFNVAVAAAIALYYLTRF